MKTKLYSQQEVGMDSKGRVSIPPAFRKLFGDEVVVLKWKDHLKVFTPEFFAELTGFAEEKLSAMDSDAASVFNRNHQIYRRLFYSNRFDMNIDTNNRLTVPKTLRNQLKIFPLEEAIWLACGDYLELWSVENHKADCARLGETGGYDELFTGSPPVTPSALNPTAGPEGDGLQ